MTDTGPGAPVVAPGEVADYLESRALALDHTGAPADPLLFIALNPAPAHVDLAAAVDALAASHVVLVGLAADGVDPDLRPLTHALDCTLVETPETSADEVAVSDVLTAARRLATATHNAPRAALALRALLRLTTQLPVADGLVAESLAYSMLLAGTEFRRWRTAHPVRPVPRFGAPAVVSTRAGRRLDVQINRPSRHNAYSREVRDGMLEALDLVLLDPRIQDVHLSGTGPSFCSGGDLDEFGSSADVTTAHLIRLDRSVAARIHRCRDRVTAHLHGACIGAGVEIPSFAGRVVATEDAFCQLPELAMGLVPGAGGTVGIAKRIGRWRTAYLALGAARISAVAALKWGLVDAVDRV